jgi:hypothetical protein
MWKTVRSKNPKNFGLLKTTTFITQASYYVQHLISAIPNATMMTAIINNISPVGQKQEIISPIPNATAYPPEKLLFLHRIQPTTLIMNKTVISFVLSHYIQAWFIWCN